MPFIHALFPSSGSSLAADLVFLSELDNVHAAAYVPLDYEVSVINADFIYPFAWKQQNFLNDVQGLMATNGPGTGAIDLSAASAGLILRSAGQDEAGYLDQSSPSSPYESGELFSGYRSTGEDFSFSMWWYLTNAPSAAGTDCMFGCGDREGSDRRGYSINCYDTTRTLRLIWADSPTVPNVLDHATPMTLSAWHLIVVRWDSAAGEIGLSLNGGPFQTKSASRCRVPNNGVSAQSPKLGSDYGIASNQYRPGRGYVDQNAVWHRALSDAEVSTLYNGGAGLPYVDW